MAPNRAPAGYPPEEEVHCHGETARSVLEPLCGVGRRGVGRIHGEAIGDIHEPQVGAAPKSGDSRHEPQIADGAGEVGDERHRRVAEYGRDSPHQDETRCGYHDERRKGDHGELGKGERVPRSSGVGNGKEPKRRGLPRNAALYCAIPAHGETMNELV